VTIKQQTKATYRCRPKSVSAGYGCGLRCTPALSVTHSADAAAVCGMWHYLSGMPLPFPSRDCWYTLIVVHYWPQSLCAFTNKWENRSFIACTGGRHTAGLFPLVLWPCEPAAERWNRAPRWSALCFASCPLGSECTSPV